MKVILRWILSVTLKPFLQHYYLKSSRPFSYGKLKLTVEPGVFHPGLFFSSQYLAGFIEKLTLQNQKLLDIGCGSGLLSLVAAQQGAEVVSIDLNESAVANTQSNAQLNQLKLTAIHSNLFDHLEGEFDIIVVNPPYFPKNAETQAHLAWYCGDSFQYFHHFFAALGNYITPQSQTFMVLSEHCDVKTIDDIAKQHHFELQCVSSKKFWLETNFIYAIRTL